MSHFRKPSAVLLAVAVLTGIPYLLLWHLPWPELPQSWDVAAAHLRGRGLPPGTSTALLIVALWTLWGLYAAGLAVEVLARLRGLPRVLRPLGPLQAVAATAVAAVAANPAAALADTVASPDAQEEDTRREGEAPPAPEASASGRPAERVRTVSGFAVGSSGLTEQMREDLAPVAEMIAAYGDADSTVRVTGHTDPSGGAAANMELSERRAQAVADHLAELLGEDAPGIEVRGVGSEEPRGGGPESQRRAEVAYTVAPRVQPDAEAAGADEAVAPAPDTGVREAAAHDSDPDSDRRVVVVEVPDGAVTGAAAFAGLAGGYLLGRRDGRLPRISLSLPRAIPGPRRLALPAPPPRPAPGEDIDERVTVELDHVPGLGITGPGAAGAARRLVADALDRLGENAVRVLLTEADAVRLLGERGRDLLRSHPCEPVEMVGTMEGALAVLQRELHRGSDGSRPPLALVAFPSPRHETALSALLLHGQRQGITAVVLGRWPLGGSCVIEEDGLITETSPPLNPLFHCSWPGASESQVLSAVRAYHHSSPARTAGAPAAPPVPEPEPHGERLRALPERAREHGDAERGDTAFWDAEGFALMREERNAFWDAEAAPTAEDGPPADAPSAEEEEQPAGTSREEDGQRTGAPPTGDGRTTATPPEEGAPTAAASSGARVPPERDGAATGIRRRTTAADTPERGDARTDQAQGAVRVPARAARPREAAARPETSAPTARMRRLEKLGTRVGSPASAPDTAVRAEGEADAAQPSRPLPRKPKKAGRGRSWRPREGG